MKFDIPICNILERNGLRECALFIRNRINEVDPSRFVELLCNPQHSIHIPLACIFWDVPVQKNDIGATEMDKLLEAIEKYQNARQLSESDVGMLLDYVLKCQLQHRHITCVSDLTCIFSLLRSPESTWILDLLDKPTGVFWYKLFNKWVSGYGVQWIEPQTVDLLKSGDVSELQNVFLCTTDSQKVQAFLEDLDLVQNCPYYLLVPDWQQIIARRTGTDENATLVLHAAVLARCFLNWLADMDDAAYDTDFPTEIANVVMALVQDREWRFRDIEKLFGFSKRPEDLPGLLAALMQIQEAGLGSGALDRLPKNPSLNDVVAMLENDREFDAPTETSRADAIRIIVNSDFSNFNHSEAKISEEALTQMMLDFDSAYEGNSGSDFENEAKAIKAVEKFFNVKMRDVQILGVLLARHARRANVSRLLQMQTGEGKTFVIAALAIAEVLHGNKVDIITSSEDLAVTQTAELKDLYDSVGISVRHCCDDSREEKESSKVYEADVVYGTASSFMFDVLDEEFFGSKIRYNRGFPLAIVDEVDAQLLDHANHICRFSSSASGMGNLLGMKATVWMLVNNNFQNIKFGNGAWNVETEDGTVPIRDFGTLKKYFVNGLLETAEKKAGFQEGAKEEETVPVPTTLETYCKQELPLWIDSAVTAILKKLDFEYCIEDGNIVIVDSSGSGTRNRGMRWSHGLHEFLEMRHGANLKTGGLTMCYLSTMSFCRRYGTNVIGLTGTIGGTASRKFLHEVYNVDFVEIPPFMVWRHISLPHVFCENTDQWLQTVVDKTVAKLNDGRACLVITEYIHNAELLCKEIGSRTSGRVGTYTGDDGDMDVSGKISPGTCIVATNVAGRGTDFKITEEVEKAGGLHVMLTSLPGNDRVERQNIGRSSRTGQRGTSQMILNVEDVDGYYADEMLRRCGEGASHTLLINTLKEVRDDWVLQCVTGWISQMETIQRSDAALTKFITMRNELVDRFKDFKEKPEDEDQSYIQMYMQYALNIRFGIYLGTQESALDPDTIQNDFKDLEDIKVPEDIPKCFSDYVNPVRAAWTLKWNPSDEPEEFHLVQQLLTRAIDLDPLFAGAAYYIRGYSFLHWYKYSDNTDHIWEAVEDFKLSRKVLERLLEQYQLISMFTMRKGEDNTKIAGQMDRLMTICGCIMGNIDLMVGRNVGEELGKLRKQIDATKKNGADITELEKQVKELEDNRETLEKGVLKEIADEGAELTIKEYMLKDILKDNINVDDFKEEISCFEREGYFRLVCVKKREKINWWNVAAVALLGIIQIIGGALLAVFTGGAAAAFGVSLMVSGCFDIFTAIKSGIIDRDFSWEAYGMEKLFDLVTSAAMAGFSGLKKAAQGIAKGVKAMTKIGTSQVAKQALKHAAKHAGKTVALTTFKITANEVMNATVAGPMKEAVADLLKSEIENVISSKIRDNPNLHHIVDVDNHHNSQKYSSEFVSRASNKFIDTFSPKLLDSLRKSIGEGVKGNSGVAKGVKTAISVSNVAIVVEKVVRNIEILPQTLEEVAREAKSGGQERHDDRLYENKGERSVDSVIGDLAKKIADFCAVKAVSKAQSFVSNKISNMVINSAFKKANQQLENFKKSFIHSTDVADRARTAISKSKGKNEKQVLESIAHIAENHNAPGDRLQAKYLADAVQAPIEITYKDVNGNDQLIVHGKEYSKNAPIRLHYEQGKNGGIGHYRFADGTHATPTGRNTCLFDTVSQVTKYRSDELKRATANHMLSDIANVKNTYMRSSYADLLVGGVLRNGQLYSSSAEKHVESVATVNDVLTKANNTQTNRKFPVRTNTIVDNDKTAFDNKATADFDNWWFQKLKNNRPPTSKIQHDYYHDESNIYEVQYSPRRQNPIAINAYRGKAVFKVEYRNGPVHFDNSKTRQTSLAKQQVWKAGDPVMAQLKNLFTDHPDHGK